MAPSDPKRFQWPIPAPDGLLVSLAPQVPAAGGGFLPSSATYPEVSRGVPPAKKPHNPKPTDPKGAVPAPPGMSPHTSDFSHPLRKRFPELRPTQLQLGDLKGTPVPPRSLQPPGQEGMLPPQSIATPRPDAFKPFTAALQSWTKALRHQPAPCSHLLALRTHWCCIRGCLGVQWGQSHCCALPLRSHGYCSCTRHGSHPLPGRRAGKIKKKMQ